MDAWYSVALTAATALTAWLAATNYSRAVAVTTALIPAYLVRLTVFGLPTNVFELLVVSLLVVGIVRPSVRQSWHRAWHCLPWPPLLLIGLWLVASLMSAFISIEPQVSLGILKGWIVIPLIFGGIVFAVANYPADQQKIIKALVWSGTATAAWGLTQLIYQLPATNYQLSRISSIYDVPNSLALWLTPIFVLSIWPILHEPKRREWRRVIPALVMGAAIIATQSAGAVLSVAAATVIGALVWLQPARRAAVIIGLAGVLVVVGGVFTTTGRLPYLVSPWTTGEPNSLTVRFQLWSIAAELLAEHPLLGIGLGQFEPAYQAKLHERFLQPTPYQLTFLLPEFVFRDPHNWILSFWLNTGLIGLVSFAGIHVWLFWHLFPPHYKLPATSYQLQPPALALIALLIFGLVDTIYWKNDLATLHWVLLALVLSACQTVDKKL